MGSIAVTANDWSGLARVRTLLPVRARALRAGGCPPTAAASNANALGGLAAATGGNAIALPLLGVRGTSREALLVLQTDMTEWSEVVRVGPTVRRRGRDRRTALRVDGGSEQKRSSRRRMTN